MAELKTDYELAFKKHYSDSTGHGGRQTGFAFEEWLVKRLKKSGIELKKGNLNFEFGEFAVDAAIPDSKNPKTILEIKVYADAQHLLMLHGLFARAKNPEIKIGMVTLYNVKDETHPDRIIKDLSKVYSDRFRYFHLQNGWSGEMAQLRNWCK